MTTIAVATETRSPWGTFDLARDRLYRQFQNVPYFEDTGRPAEEVEAMARTFLAAHPDMPRVLQKAHAFRIVVDESRIHVDPFDWFTAKVDHAGIVSRIRDEWYQEAKNGPLRAEAGWFDRVYKLGVVVGLLDMHHIAPGWENMFEGGLRGLLDRAAEAKKAGALDLTQDQRDFYEALEIAYDAVLRLAERFADRAELLAAECPDEAPRLETLGTACRRVPARAPETFHQALQFIWFLQIMVEIEGESPMSLGHFDRMLHPYYRADVDAGRLTPERAKELIKYFWFKYHARLQGQNDSARNFTLGGQCPDGSDAVNELTYLALDARWEMDATDPKMSVRVFPGSPDRLYRHLAKIMRAGHTVFVLLNDARAVPALVKRGKTLEDARSYLSIGCYEPAVDGKEAACTMNLTFNLAKPVELALNDGVDPASGEQVGPRTGDPSAFRTFDELLRAYLAQLDFVVGRSVEYVAAHERQWPRINPSPLLAGSISDCIARGRDIGEGGARYNSVGCVGAGLASAADSLAALQAVVYEDHKYTIEQVIDALKRDFAGCESMRQYLVNRVPKWGNNHPQADALGRRIADFFCGKVHTLRNGRGGGCQAGVFSLTHRIHFGHDTGALPDGRKAGTSLSPNTGAMVGCDRGGVTALMNSLLKLDFTETPNGSVLDVMIHPSALEGEEGLEAFVGLIKTYFAGGGYGLQFNVVSAETLRDAQKHPERYATLQVRVTGWSVYFNALSPDEQEHFINRVRHNL